MNKHKKKFSLFHLINAIIIILICFATIYPFYYIIICSISDGSELIKGSISIIPKGINLNAYKTLFNYPLVGRAYLNTLLYVSLSTVISLLLTILGAYPLSRRTFKARKVFSFYVAFTMLFSGGLIPTYIVVNGLGLNETILAMIIPYALNAYNLIVLRTFFQTIPEEFIEAAKIDGCSQIGILFKIVIPCSSAGIATIFLFYLVSHWNSFMPGELYMIESPEKLPIQNILRQIVISENNIDSSMSSPSVAEGVRYAAIVITAIPIILVYPFLQKYFEKGLIIGGIKG